MPVLFINLFFNIMNRLSCPADISFIFGLFRHTHFFFCAASLRIPDNRLFLAFRYTFHALMAHQRISRNHFSVLFYKHPGRASFHTQSAFHTFLLINFRNKWTSFTIWENVEKGTSTVLLTQASSHFSSLSGLALKPPATRAHYSVLSCLQRKSLAVTFLYCRIKLFLIHSWYADISPPTNTLCWFT